MDGRAPGVLIEFVEAPPAIEPTRVDVPALVCVTERGPMNTPVRVGSHTAFAAAFGTFVRNGLGAYAAKAFFDGGGGPAWVVRVAAPERTTTTSGPQPADRLTSVVAATTGLVVGAVATLTQPGVSHDYLVLTADAATATVGWDRPLHPAFDLTLPVDVATGAGFAAATVADDSGTPSLRLSAASPGSWGGRVEVATGPGGRSVTASRDGVTSGVLVTPVVTTAGFRVGDACRLSQEIGGVAVEASAVVAAVDAGRRVLTWAAPLPGVLDLTRPFIVEASTFALAVLAEGAVVETWPDLSQRPEHPRYIASALAASGYVRAELLGGGQPAAARVRLTGGRDGTAALTTGDLLGDELLDDGIGLAALVGNDEPGVVCVPDLVAPPTPARVIAPPHPADPCDPCAEPDAGVPDALEAVLQEAGASFGAEEIVAAQAELVASCERNTERVALLDPPHDASTLAALRSWAVRFSSSYALATAPWLNVVEPSDSRAVRPVPPCGHLAGLISRCDTESGPWLSPANRTLAWAHGLAVELSDAEHAVANDESINLVRALRGRGLVPMGARTLAADDALRFTAVRRTLIQLRRTLRHHLAWVPFEPNDAALAALLTSSIGTLLTDLWEAGGLAGNTADEAFIVAVDNGQAAVGQLRIAVGVALSRPAEFVFVRVSRTGNRLEIGEAPTLVPGGAA